jgi:hypothetical protein
MIYSTDSKAYRKFVSRRTPLQIFIQDELKLQQTNYVGMQTVPIRQELVHRPETPFKIRHCHDNCERAAAAQPEDFEVVTCWIISNHRQITEAILRRMGRTRRDVRRLLPRKGEFEAIFHSILRNRVTGQLFDITPDDAPNCTERTVVLEPRLTSADFSMGIMLGLGSPESIDSATYAERAPQEKVQLTIFEQLAVLKTFVLWDLKDE